MAIEYRSVFNIGLYAPRFFDEFPYVPSDYDKAIYLSEKKRKCSWTKAAEFDSLDEARSFYEVWENGANFKTNIVEYKRYVEIPGPVFPENHPYNVLKRIQKNERVNILVTADLWFRGKINEHYVSKQTLKRHKKILLGYGIDIEQKPKEIYHQPKIKRDEVWHTASPELKVIDNTSEKPHNK